MDEDFNDQTAPAWANALLERINAMEQRLQTSPLVNDDPNVVMRAPGADFTPSSLMLSEFPFLEEDFFKRPLADSDRRRFLFDCPKNTLRTYDPPKLNKVNLNSPYKQFDASLYTLQYRISGITRPLDWFGYQLLHEQWDLATLQQQTRDFTHAIHELLSDLASHITQLRIDNMFRGLPNHLEPPAPSTDTFLIGTQDMLDHIKLQQSVRNATQQQRKRHSNNGPRPKRSSNNGDASTNHTQHNHDAHSNHSGNNGFKQQSNAANSNPSHQQQRGFHNGHNHQKKF